MHFFTSIYITSSLNHVVLDVIWCVLILAQASLWSVHSFVIWLPSFLSTVTEVWFSFEENVLTLTALYMFQAEGNHIEKIIFKVKGSSYNNLNACFE